LQPFAILASALWLTACGVEIQNLQPARELARAAEPGTSVYTGWRVFQDKCASCHGADARGGAEAPDLTQVVLTMGERRFTKLVLLRYDWQFSPSPAGRDDAAFEAMVDRVTRRQEGALTMPAWQGEPVVTAHILDLYAFLAARADGTQGPGRPVR
jgi:mono/diheme cytochrome c family protein